MSAATALARRSASPVQAPADDVLLGVEEVARLLKCTPASVYNLTRERGRSRYDNPIPVIRAPFGLRFKKSSIMEWLASLETRG